MFGASLSIVGERALVGAPGVSGGQGAAYLYTKTAGGAWQLEATLSSSDESLGEGRLGSAVLLTADRAYVGAPLGNGATGTVLVFEPTDDGWAQTGQLDPSNGGFRGRFGSTLASAGDEVWVGAPSSAGGDGTAYRFIANSDGWSDAEAFQADSANTAAWPFGFGSSIAASEEAVAIGMPRRDFGEGRASVLTKSGDSWAIESTVMGEIFTAVPGAMEGLECEDGKIAAFDCSNMELVSYTPVSALGGARGVWVNDVWGWTDPETGRNYALVARRDGAAFVDVSNTASPRLVGSLLRTDGSRPSVWRDIKVYADHAFIVSDGAGAHGMQVFDLTRLREVDGEPVDFTADAHYDNIYSAHNVVANQESGFLYIVGSNGGGETCGGGLHMVDVRTPTEPTFAGCYTDDTGANARGYTHDAHCVMYAGPDERYQGREICVAANEVEINIADVTDKSDPTPIGRSGYPNAAYAHQGWLDEDHRYFYMGDEADEVQGSVAGTRTLVWDLSELDDPILVREYIGPVQATDHNLFINGDRAYMSNYGSGLRRRRHHEPREPPGGGVLRQCADGQQRGGHVDDLERRLEQLPVLRRRSRHLHERSRRSVHHAGEADTVGAVAEESVVNTIKQPPAGWGRMDDAIRLPDGRSLSYRLLGDPEGRPLMVFHGTPGSRAGHSESDPLATTPGLRLILPDRPGYGGSDVHPHRTLSDWPQGRDPPCGSLGVG